MKSKDKKFKTILEELNYLKTQLSEDYIFGDDEGAMEDPSGMGEQMPPQEDGVNPALVQPRQSQQQMGNGDSEEEIAMHAQEIIQHEPIVGKIRETAIEGLKKYADHPTSDLYAYFKDVFLSSDKLLTGKGK
jgi:hypothetical protein